MNTDMNVDICTGSSSSACSSSSSWTKETKQEQGREQKQEQQAIQRVGDTYAIEIKPKQGWLQLPSDVSDLFDLMPEASDGQTIDPAQLTSSCNRSRGEGKCRCRYCSMQQLKVSATLQSMFVCHLTLLSLTLTHTHISFSPALQLQTGKIKRLSNYCPLELFSG